MNHTNWTERDAMSNETKELTILFQAMKQAKERRMYERYQAVYLYLQGYSYKQVADVIGRSDKTVYNYVKAYQQGGLDGLIMGVSPGAPRKLTLEQEQELVHTIIHSLPVDVGFPARHNWTLALIASFIESKWGKTYTLRGVSRLLHDLGLSYFKATYTLANADTEKQAVFKEETFPA